MDAPKLRFKRYTNNWKHKLMSEVVAINPKVGSLPERFIYIDLDSVNSGVLVTKKIIEKKNAPSRAQRLLSDQDILIQTVRPYQKNHLLFKTLEMESVASTGYAQLKTKVEIDPEFIYQLFYTGRINEEINKRCTGTSYPAISAKDLETLYISIPSYDEQVRISVFLKTIDKKIQLQQEKIDLLKEQKKGYMQKIFSQELRFKDRDGQKYPSWERLKLKEFLVPYAEKTTCNNQYPPLTSSRDGIFLQSEYFKRQVASEDNTGYNIVPYGYFTYRHMSDDATFKFNINDIVENGIVSTLYPVFTTNEKLDMYFLKFFLNESPAFKQYGLLQQQGGSRTYMYFSKLIEFESEFPNIEEQRRIAEFLNIFDKKIQKETLKYDQLIEQKQAFMQQMFI